MNELLRWRKRAQRILKKKALAHVVYAYISKERPHETCILVWKPLEFKTDAEFDNYLKLAAPAAEMIYAVHRNKK